MKSYIKGAVIYIAIIAAAVTGAYSYSTSDINIAGNSITVGQLSLQVNDENVDLVPIHIDNLKPGDRVSKVINLKNGGTIDINNIQLSLTNVNDPAFVLNKIAAVINHGKKVLPPEGPIYSPVNVSLVHASDMINIPLLVQSARYEQASEVIPVPVDNLMPFMALEPGGESRVSIEFVVPQDFDINAAKGQSLSFDLRLSGSQF